MNIDDIRFFVRTTGERELDESYSQIEYELLIDREHQPIKSFVNQLVYISEWNSVLLEDDLVLCQNFKEEIMKVINTYPDEIVNFFSNPNMYTRVRKTSNFLYNQCTYYPISKNKELSKCMKEMYITKDIIPPYDLLESEALKKLGFQNIVYRPCIVQHLDDGSLIAKYESRRRITPFFIDWLKKYNFDYNHLSKEDIEVLNKEVERFKSEHKYIEREIHKENRNKRN